MDKDKKDNLLTLNLKAGQANPAKSPVKTINNQTNPIYKSLFKFIHAKLIEDKESGGFLSKFKPKDLL